MPKLTPAEIKMRLDNIQKIYEEYKKEIKSIRHEEQEIISDFIKKLEAKKINEIRQTINNNYK